MGGTWTQASTNLFVFVDCLSYCDLLLTLYGHKFEQNSWSFFYPSESHNKSFYSAGAPTLFASVLLMVCGRAVLLFFPPFFFLIGWALQAQSEEVNKSHVSVKDLYEKRSIITTKPIWAQKSRNLLLYANGCRREGSIFTPYVKSFYLNGNAWNEKKKTTIHTYTVHILKNCE